MAKSKSKYVVFKRSDYERLRRNGGDSTAWSRAILKDAEVLRLQDITVAPALHNYASIILSIMDLTPGTHEYLLDVHDWAQDAAMRSEALGPKRKLPD